MDTRRGAMGAKPCGWALEPGITQRFAAASAWMMRSASLPRDRSEYKKDMSAWQKPRREWLRGKSERRQLATCQTESTERTVPKGLPRVHALGDQEVDETSKKKHKTEARAAHDARENSGETRPKRHRAGSEVDQDDLHRAASSGSGGDHLLALKSRVGRASHPGLFISAQAKPSHQQRQCPDRLRQIGSDLSSSITRAGRVQRP